MPTYIDPPSGWRYGFPKALPNPAPENIHEWLVSEGYPQSEIDACGKYFYCRQWEGKAHYTGTDNPIDFPKRPVMNDKIEHCLYESGLTAQGCWDELDDYAKQSIQRFAELIVRECSKVIRNGGYRRGAFGNEDLRPSEIATMIEEHFGVE